MRRQDLCCSYRLLPTRIDHRCARILEIPDIAGDEDEVVDDRSGGDQPVDIAAGADRGDATPFDGDLVGQPRGQRQGPARGWRGLERPD